MAFNWIGQSEDKKTVMLKAFDGGFCFADYATDQWIGDNQDKIKTGCVIDVETTGLNQKTDVIIEIGLRLFQFNRLNGDLLKVVEGYSSLQDPLRPLTEDIKRLTGITDEQLKGKQIDWKKVEELLLKSNVVIAHNAGFDRPFLDRTVSASKECHWVCSFKQVDWSEKGFFTSKLEFLSIYHGFYVGAHRALNDADALLHLLSFLDLGTKRSYLDELLQRARKPVVLVSANQSPFESKDALRARGYRWDTQERVWSKMLLKELLDDEIAWMEAAVYNGKFKGIAQEISTKDLFK